MNQKSTHETRLVRLGPPRVHTNADTLEIFDIGGYQVVTKKGNFKAGDLAVYIQPDSVVPQTPAFDFLEGKSRITVRRFRGEWSEGLLMPVTDFNAHTLNGGPWKVQVTKNGDPYVFFENSAGGTTCIPEGVNIAELLGITHYVPEFDREKTAADAASAPKRRHPRSLRGWFYWTLHKFGLKPSNDKLDLGIFVPVYDVDVWKNNTHKMPFGTKVQVTEKIHGSNARYVFIDGYLYAGSHYQWKKRGDNIWWRAVEACPEIEEWCTQNPGKVLYGEVGPTQKGFRYGCDGGETFFFAFRVYDPETGLWAWAGSEGFKSTVPHLGVQILSPDILALADGPSLVPGAKNIREGIVLKDDAGLTFKVVGNKFLEGDSK